MALAGSLNAAVLPTERTVTDEGVEIPVNVATEPGYQRHLLIQHLRRPYSDCLKKPVEPDELALTRGISEAFQTVLRGMSWQTGDEIIVTSDEEAALLLPEAIEVQIDPTAAHEFALEGVAPIVVPHGEFYRIDTALVVPTIDPAEWTLTVKGMVDDEIVLDYDQISAMPLVERYVTLACVSNKVGDGLVGNALWTGVPLRDLLDMAGVGPGVEQVGRFADIAR